jgi:hypothetical protein
LEPRLYDVIYLQAALACDVRLNALGRVAREYLRRGAHPFLLEQAVTIALLKAPSRDRDAAVEKIRAIAREVNRPAEPMPQSWALGLEGPASRLYLPTGEPRPLRNLGIVFGVIVETVAQIMKWKLLDNSSATSAWKEYRAEFFERILSSPNADFGVLEMLERCAEVVDFQLGLERPPFAFGGPSDQFIARRATALSLEDLIRELLDSWDDEKYLWFHEFYGLALGVRENSGEARVFPRTLEVLLKLSREGSPRIRSAAARVFSSYPMDQKVYDPSVAEPIRLLHDVMIGRIKKDLGDLRTRHTVIRWIQRVNHDMRRMLLGDFAFSGPAKDGKYPIDERCEVLMEDIFGLDAWKAICSYQDISKWKFKAEIHGRPLTSDPDESRPEWGVLTEAARNPQIDRHEPNVAECFEGIVRTGATTETEARKTLEHNLNLLSGDIVVTVSHIPDDWRQLKRKPREFLGAALPRIDFAKNKKYGDRGAACRFRIYLPDLPTQPLCGSLDPEGELSLDNTPILDSISRLAVQAAVTQTLCAVLIPRLIESVPANGNAGVEVVIVGEPLARRPVIHTLGEIGAEDEQEDQPSRGMRLNPMIALFVFRWLLGQYPEYECHLHFQTEEKAASGKDVYYVSAPSARQDLVRKKLKLSQVFIRAVRAHTRPLSAYLDETNTVRVKQRSARADRNYQRYRQQDGRELTFAPVPKTYILPGGLRVPVQVERTFNRGHFVSLEDALKLIFDSTLKAEILQKFAL